MQKFLLSLTATFMIALAACSSEPAAETKKAAEKTPEPVTGSTALFRMYQVARAWAPDATVLKMTSIRMTEVPYVAGKAGAWEATFVSEAKSKAKPYTYSVVEGEGMLHQGVFGRQEQPWSPDPRGASAPFLISSIKVDTDAALNMALANGGYDYEKTKGKAKTISFQLEKLSKFANPSWRVIWGESAGTSAFSVYIDAFANAFLERMH